MARRSREGAWIEMRCTGRRKKKMMRRSRKGAWIEILAGNGIDFPKPVSPGRERGLK